MKTSIDRPFVKITVAAAVLGLSIFALVAQPRPAPPGPAGPVNVVGAGSEVQSAFLEVNPIDQLTAPSAPASKKERLDRFNTLWLSAPSAKLDLNLFGDAKLRAVIDRFESMAGVGVFYGHLDGDDAATVLLAHRDGALEARISGPNGRVFDVSYGGGDMLKIAEVDPLLLRDALRDGVQTANSAIVNVDGGPSSPQAPDTATPPVIDVMVLYTTQEKNGLGGQAATEARIALCVAYNNEAFRRSYVNARYRLVHTEEVTESWHVPSQTASTELGWLRSDSMVAQRQSSFGADVVSLLCYITDWGGLADCSAPHSVFYHYPEFFTHECGHNVGCGHDRAHGGCGAADYAYG